MPADRLKQEWSSDNLPADLAELAGQLVDDAAFLASLYPARSCDTVPSAVASASAMHPRSTHRAALVAAVLLGAVGVGLVATNFVSDEPETAEGRRALAAAEAAVTPVVSWEFFTGAEQEAVLDLLEQEGVEQGSLSI
jgi:hypothetical protein